VRCLVLSVRPATAGRMGGILAFSGQERARAKMECGILRLAALGQDDYITRLGILS
jgi:hypothetical protein